MRVTTIAANGSSSDAVDDGRVSVHAGSGGGSVLVLGLRDNDGSSLLSVLGAGLFASVVALVTTDDLDVSVSVGTVAIAIAAHAVAIAIAIAAVAATDDLDTVVAVAVAVATMAASDGDDLGSSVVAVLGLLGLLGAVVALVTTDD